MHGTELDAPHVLDPRTWSVDAPAAPRTSPPGLAPTLGAAFSAPGTAAFRQRATEECLDTLGVLRGYREPLPGEPWALPLNAERRLLAQADAIVGLGEPSLAHAEAIALNPDVPDPDRLFAAIFALASVVGDAGLTRALRLFGAAVRRNQAEMSAAIEALSLAPHPDIALRLVPLLADDEPRIRAAAVRVLSFRGQLPEGAWERAMRDPKPGVVAAAAWAPLHGYSRDRCDAVLRTLADTDNEQLARPVLRAGLSLRLRFAYDAAWRAAARQPGWAGALSCAAMFGAMADAGRVVKALDAPDPWPAIQAAGHLGSVELVAPLVALLERPGLDPLSTMAVRQALWKVTGIDFDGAERAGHVWATQSGRFDPSTRYRAGQPFGADVLLDQLRQGPGERALRQDTYLDLQSLTRCEVPRFNPWDFVRTQADSLQRVGRWLHAQGVIATSAHTLH